jgi:hypothetical protein
MPALGSAAGVIAPGGGVVGGFEAGAAGAASGPGFGTGPGRHAKPVNIRKAPKQRTAAVNMGAR